VGQNPRSLSFGGPRAASPGCTKASGSRPEEAAKCERTRVRPAGAPISCNEPTVCESPRGVACRDWQKANSRKAQRRGALYFVCARCVFGPRVLTFDVAVGQIARSMKTMRTTLAGAILTAILALGGCKDEPKSTRWADAAAVMSAPAPIASIGPVAEGSNFNAAFPPDGVDGHKRVFTQEKDGFAEAKLQKDGKDVATLSISDTNANADAKGKFAEAKEKLGEWPMLTVGKNQTTVLVKDRYQVKVSSPTLDHDARKKLLEKFDLKRL
jgi:hypothetical protein